MNPEIPAHADTAALPPLDQRPAGPSSSAGCQPAVPASTEVGETGKRVRPLWLRSWLVVPLLGLAGGVCLLSAVLSSRSAQAHSVQARNGSSSPVADASALPVNTIKPQRKTLVRTLEQPGSIRPFAQAELFAKTSGYLKRIARENVAPQTVVGVLPGHLSLLNAASFPLLRCAPWMAGRQVQQWQAPQKDIGSRVKAGEVLLEIDVPELVQDVVQKESQIKLAEAELAKAHQDLGTYLAAEALCAKQLARLKSLALTKNISEELVDEKQAELSSLSSKLAAAKAEITVREARLRVARNELERAKVLAEYAHIHAPFDGIITYRGVDEGDFVQNATSGQARPLMSIIASDKVKVVLQVPEREAVWVQPGTPAAIRMDARIGWHIEARVTRVCPSLDSQARTRQVEIDVDNPDQKLMPGMYGDVTLTLQKIENALAIPATAVYSRRGENYILQVLGGCACRQRVRIRFDDGKELEVVKLIGDREVPLDGSEELIISNKGEIAEGQRVRCSQLTSH